MKMVPYEGGWKVYRKDRCEVCGTKEGQLEVHHKLKRKTHPELAMEPSNLMTVCQPCHAKLEMPLNIELAKKRLEANPDNWRLRKNIAKWERKVTKTVPDLKT